MLYENGFVYVCETDAVGINHTMFIKQFDRRLMETFQQVYRADIVNRRVVNCATSCWLRDKFLLFIGIF